MSTPIATITAMVIHPPDVNPCYGKDFIEIRMTDEAGGASFELRQDDHGPIRADLEELQALVIAAQRMLGREVAA
jgi:hypothetical protein